MNLEKKITITLSEQDVKEIISAYLMQGGYKVPVENITLSVGTRWEGYGRSEFQVHYFKECTAVVKGE